MYDTHTRTQTLCKLSTPVTQYPGHGYSIRIPTRNICEFCMTCTPYLQLLWVMYESIPVSITSVSSARLPYHYSKLQWVLSSCGAVPGVQVCLCQNPGYRYRVGLYVRGFGLYSGMHSDTMSRESHTSHTKLKIHLTGSRPLVSRWNYCCCCSCTVD